MPFSPLLHAVATGSIALGVTCAIVITLDEIRHPQKMPIMNAVWPLTALFGSVLWLAFYYAWGRATGDMEEDLPMPIAVAKGASHCGAGCALGDLIVEWAAFALPGIAVAFGYGSIFAECTFAVWIPDFIVAFLIGIVFQYFTIAPMRGLDLADGIKAAVKADTASITSWQVGMYGVMALAQFAWLRPSYGVIAPVDSVEFWFVMQIAMIAGFVTAYPVNWWLVSAGLKEKM